MKEWKSAKVIKPTWKKVWSPVLIQEWVPFPKPLPEWETKSTHLDPVTATSNNKLPLWDPMPYPESQQPPPPPPPPPPSPPSPPLPLLRPSPPSPSSRPPFFPPDAPCSYKGCDGDSSALTFTEEQILKIIGSHRYKKDTDYSQNDEYSESVTHLTKVPPDSENWRSRRQSPFGFPNLPDLLLHLVPPMFQSFGSNDYRSQSKQKINYSHQPPNRNNFNRQGTQSPSKITSQIQQTKYAQWTPIPSQNKVKNPQKYTTIPLDRPQKVQFSNGNAHVQGNPANQKAKNGLNNHAQSQFKLQHQYPQTNNKQNFPNKSSFFQPAELVGEYHYSEVDYERPIKQGNPVEEVKFKPLPPLTLPSLKPQEEKPFNFQSLPDSKGKLRPIRKNVETLPNVHQSQENHVQHVQHVTSPPRADSVFQQEKAITKEIIPIFNITPSPFALNHRFEPHPVYKSPANATSKANENSGETSAADNGSGKANIEQSTKPGNSIQLQLVYPKPGEKSIVQLSEATLINALSKSQKELNSATVTSKFPNEGATTQFSIPIPSSQSENLNSTNEVVTKSPVFIVTPIYQKTSN